MPTVPGPNESARMLTTEKDPLINPNPRPDTVGTIWHIIMVTQARAVNHRWAH